MNYPKSCLICGEELPEGKPLLDNEADQECSKFRTAFQLFCQLMSGSDCGRELDQIVDQVLDKFRMNYGFNENAIMMGIPCCMSCNQGMCDILKVQESIEELKADQILKVNGLKNLLIETECSETRASNDWEQIRSKIFSLMPQQFSTYLRARKHQNANLPPAASLHQPGKWIPNILRRNKPRPKRKFVSTVSPERDSIPSPTPQAYGETFPVPTSTTAGSVNYGYHIRPCSVVLERIIPPVSIPIKVEPAVESKPKRSLDLAASTARAKSKQNFSIVDQSSNILLFKSCLVQMSCAGSRLSCMENCCDITFHSTDGIVLFDMMRDHIESCHLAGGDSGGVPKPCPLCGDCLATGKQFRAHLISGHSIDQVICEICLKPMRNIGDNYRRHRWNHKNDAEKLATEEGPPKAIIYTAVMRSKKMRKHIENLGFELPEKVNCKKAYEFIKKTKTTKARSTKPETKKTTRQKCTSSSGPAHEELVQDNCRKLVPLSAPPTRTKFRQNFSLIDPSTDTLMYKYSLVAASCAGTKLTCMESNCSEYFQALDGLDLFERMRKHVDINHLSNDKSPTIRSCPLCNASFKCGKKFRKHLISGDHSIDVVVCEVCFKPVRNTCDIYKRHRWSHKSDAEKLADEGGPPKAIIYSAVMRSRKMRERYERMGFKLPEKDVFAKKRIQVKRIKRVKNPGVESGTTRNKKFKRSNSNSGLPVQRCAEKSVPICNLLAETDEVYQETEDDYNPNCSEENEIENEANQEQKPQISKNPTLTFKPCKSLMFWKIEADLLFYKYTTIQVSNNGNQMTCMEPHCSHLEVAHDNNYSALFERMATHIDVRHAELEPLANSDRSCPVQDCNEFFTEIALSKYRSHVLKNHSVETVVCEICWKPIRHVADVYKSHKWLHQSDQEKIECGVLPAGVMNTATKVKKLRRKLEELGFEIPIKQKKRRNKEESMKEQEERPLFILCEICGKPFKSKDALLKHQWSHKSHQEKDNSSEPPPPKVVKQRQTLMCQDCGRIFNSQPNLIAHMQSHLARESRKQWLCSECPMEFLSSRALQNHSERLHHPDPESHFKYCPVCNLRFFYRDTTRFRTHVKSHKSNERPFRCDKCQMSFTDKHRLTRHQRRVHTDARIFKCEYCHESYKHQGNLHRHKRSAHPGSMKPVETKFVYREFRPDFIGPKIAFPCEICEKVFPLRSRMTKHVKLRHHRELAEGLIKI